MRFFIPAVLVSLIAVGCSTYTELTPVPDLLPSERGYIELRNDTENFSVEKDGKYFMKFPKPDEDNTCLVLKLSEKRSIVSLLSRTFDDGKSPMTPIPDEGTMSDSLLVFAVDQKSQEFFWVIDSVSRDHELIMKYRYVPRWRYTFEVRYGIVRTILGDNRVDRTTYESIDENTTFTDFDFAGKLGNLAKRTKNLEAAQADVEEMGRLFPQAAITRQDTAYLAYQLLQKDLAGELDFQRKYASALAALQKERDTQGSTQLFVEQAPYFSRFLKEKGQSPKITERVKKSIAERLNETVAYYDEQLKRHASTAPFKFTPSIREVDALFVTSGVRAPTPLAPLAAFVERFNTVAETFASGNRTVSDLERTIEQLPAQAPPSTYKELADRGEKARSTLAALAPVADQLTVNYPCAQLIDSEVSRTVRKSGAFAELYEGAYQVASATASQMWTSAESNLRTLSLSSTAAEFPTLAQKKGAIVQHLEEDLGLTVQEVSRKRAETFAAAQILTLQNVPKLYSDSSFQPVHILTFSAAGPNALLQRIKRIDGMLERVRTVDFPAAAIKAIYRELTRDPNSRGVDKARAVVEHGKFYTGDDKQVKTLVDECDVQTPKWISKPKEYRKLFALPITSRPSGMNDYMFRIRLQIPSTAQFPVFDVNVKLPEELVRKARTEQWYDQITINKKQIKNEGRFRITAPLPSNGYESQITPVQMDKAGNNILEVRFRYPGYRVFEVSTMAQVPIIKKN